MTIIKTTTPDGQTVQVVQPSRTDELFQSRCLRVFVSYRDGQDEAAIHLARRMTTYGIDTFVACRDIPVGARWESEIQRAVITCEIFAAYCTPDFGDGQWTTREVQLAELHGLQIFPIRVAGLPEGPIANYRALDANATPDTMAVFVDTYSALPRMSESIVCAIERCAQEGSYDLANRLGRFLSNVRYMSDEQSERLIATYNRKSVTNSYGNKNQIREAYSFKRFNTMPSQSVITQKINELTPRSVHHGLNGDICDAPPPSNVLSPRASDEPKFTSELPRDSYMNDPRTSEGARTQSDQRARAPVSPW